MIDKNLVYKVEKEKPMYYELSPKFDSRKSFYGKALVHHNQDGSVDLQSYDTIVATITSDGQAVVHGLYSATSTRHTKEFLKQFGFKADTTKDIRQYIKED